MVALPVLFPVTPPNPPPRILISSNTAWSLYNFRRSLILALVEAGNEVVVVAPPDAYAEKLPGIGCRFIPLPMDNKGTSPRRDLELFLRYRKLLAAERPAAFLGYTVKPNVFGSLAAHSLRIPTINNISGLGTAFIRRSWVTTVVKLLYRLALGRAGRVFFQNQDDRALFVSERLVDQALAHVLPGSGIDLEHFAPVPMPVGTAPVFLLIGRLLGDKGVNEFVDAARAMQQAGSAARFQLLGYLDVENATAIARQTVEAWVAEGVIEYLGDTDDVRPFIGEADCVVLPSYREGTPRTLLEAAAMGRPLITTDTPGCRDVVDHGENGFLCAPRDSSSLTAAMQQFISLSPEQRAAMGARSRRLAEQRYDERIVIARYLEAIAAVTAPR